ncbi:MAG: FAD-dependent oxidoreductase [Bacteroidetes bacterium]|nr:FAD-dependent oxidoreductase [Bacteroidota bacterium]
MSTPGTAEHPWRIAIIGAGPAGFYAGRFFFKQEGLHVRVDVYDRLPTPHGLVRAGVAPDHEKIKNVTRVFDRTASNPSFRFFGNVEYGSDVTLEDLQAHYHQVYFSTGAQVDRPLGIPGEDLARSHSATEFVAWYNGHPDFRHLEFDLSQERVAVVGVGNVAIDVARILCKTIDELKTTDIADYALDALAESRVKEVILMGRRGPAQAAFTLKEVKEMGELEDASAVTYDEEMDLDQHSAADLEANPDRTTTSKLDVLNSFRGGTKPDASRTCQIRFLVSPLELRDDGRGAVGSMLVGRNRIEDSGSGRLNARSTGETFEWPVGLVFRSVGYRGVALPGLPFHDAWGVIHNEKGRVTSDDGVPVPGCYTGGWIKRGPSGVIGTNKPDAVETVECMLEDLSAGRHFAPTETDIEPLVRSRQPNLFSYQDWLRLDELESARGAASGRPRVKFTSVEEMIAVLRG